jgi:citrate synthase
MAADSLTITDNRTGKTLEIPIMYGTFPTYGAAIRTADLRQFKVSEDDFGLMGYDPAFMNTASTKSAITHIDGERGILRYRGYPIEQLAEQSNYLEVAYLLIYGELPTKAQYDEWVHTITYHTMVHENLKKFMDGFHYDAHPMGMLVSALAALSTFYPASKKVTEAENRELQIYRLIGKVITLGAMTYRHTKGLPCIMPDNDLSYSGNFMNMLWKMAEPRYRPNPILERALDVLFILHADHEQNCSTNAMRSVGSSQADPYCTAAGATAALYGPLHGGANEQVLRMLRQIGSKDKIPQFVQDVKDRKALLIGTRADRPGGRLFREAEALPERRLLLRDHLRGHGLPDRLLHGPIHHSPDVWVAGPVAGDDHGSGAEDCTAAADLHGRGHPRLRAHGKTPQEVRWLGRDPRSLAPITWDEGFIPSSHVSFSPPPQIRL